LINSQHNQLQDLRRKEIMDITLSSYDAMAYNSTPLLNGALQKHNHAGGDEWIHTAFGNLFREHGVENILGLTLLHHHFPLEENEYLTEVHGTSTAWNSRTGSKPSCWALNHDDRTILPLEFALDDDGHSVPYPDWESSSLQLFLKDLMFAIEGYGVAGIYGLGRYPGDGYPGRVEMTVGRANVNLTPSQVRLMQISHLKQIGSTNFVIMPRRPDMILPFKVKLHGSSQKTLQSEAAPATAIITVALIRPTRTIPPGAVDDSRCGYFFHTAHGKRVSLIQSCALDSDNDLLISRFLARLSFYSSPLLCSVCSLFWVQRSLTLPSLKRSLQYALYIVQ
jgi:hypothetical protein